MRKFRILATFFAAVRRHAMRCDCDMRNATIFACERKSAIIFLCERKSANVFPCERKGANAKCESDRPTTRSRYEKQSRIVLSQPRTLSIQFVPQFVAMLVGFPIVVSFSRSVRQSGRLTAGTVVRSTCSALRTDNK